MNPRIRQDGYAHTVGNVCKDLANMNMDTRAPIHTHSSHTATWRALKCAYEFLRQPRQPRQQHQHHQHHHHQQQLKYANICTMAMQRQDGK